MKFKVKSMLLEIIFIMKSIFSVVSGQCQGSPLDLSPNASTPEVLHITSPHYPNEYNKTADCEWTISGTGYSYEISFVEKVLHFQDPYGRNYCSGSYFIAVNGEDIDCLWPTDTEMLCFAFQQPSCGEPQINPKCQWNTYYNDTLRLTYRSDGRTSDKQNVTGFNMTIKVTKCPSEAKSTDVPTTTATSHPHTHNISTTTTKPHHHRPARKTSTPSHSGDVTATTEGNHHLPIHESTTSSQSEDVTATTEGDHQMPIHESPTSSQSEAPPPSTTLDWQTIVIVMGAGFGFLFIAMIALLLYLLYQRSNTSAPESQQPPNSEVTEMQPPPEPYYETPYEPPLSNSAQYEF